jgi:SAM-dependent methyltransferase
MIPAMGWRDWRDANQRYWEAVTPRHVRGDFYDVSGFLRGNETLRPFEIEEVGSVDGLELVHLQCHFGLDTLGWARHGATVTGLDFSPTAIGTARELAAEARLADRADFVCADVYEARDALGGEDFDVVYTGLGALGWLDDLDRWADVVVSLIRPGGILYLAEFHPFVETMADDGQEIVYGYFDFQGAPLAYSNDDDYASDAPLERGYTTFEWIWPISTVLSVLLVRGLVIERFSEHDYTLYRRWPFVRQVGATYRLPDGAPSLPLMYSLRARRPAG